MTCGDKVISEGKPERENKNNRLMRGTERLRGKRNEGRTSLTKEVGVEHTVTRGGDK